jgi:hypothetical protein
LKWQLSGQWHAKLKAIFTAFVQGGKLAGIQSVDYVMSETVVGQMV